MNLRHWLRVDAERVLLELEILLEAFDVEIGDLHALRNAVDTYKETKKSVALTEQESEIVRDLICDYRDSLAGSTDEHFDRMQAILVKFR